MAKSNLPTTGAAAGTNLANIFFSQDHQINLRSVMLESVIKASRVLNKSSLPWLIRFDA